MGSGAAVTLRRGLWDGAAWQREAVVCPLGDVEETRLASEERLLPAERATLLLAAGVERVGAVEHFGRDEARALSAGDRNVLLLRLHRLTVGERLECELACPDCGEELELEPLARDLAGEPAPADGPASLEVELSGGRRVDVRPVAGSDLEAAAALAAVDEDAAADLLLRRCITDGDASELEAPDRAAVEAALRELDPAAELVLKAGCPACDRPVEAALDPGEHVWTRLVRRARDRHREVHVLALAYHWSEREILAIGAERRRLYLELLGEGAPA